MIDRSLHTGNVLLGNDFVQVIVGGSDNGSFLQLLAKIANVNFIKFILILP